MATILFPKQLEELLKGSKLEAPIRALADQVGEILNDNKLPFFPDYTDHGIDHINAVLKSEVELVPKDVWEDSKSNSDPRLLCDADAVVIIGATLLHDLGMHLREKGFLELISKDSRFRPATWFNEEQENHPPDRPWHDLWDDFTREARRFSDRTLGDLIGIESVQKGWRFQKLPDDSGSWELNHRLIIGEFVRRHHARLAHEIAHYGFPGLTVGLGNDQFPAIENSAHPLSDLANLIGLAARSHGIQLRTCQDYLNDIHENDPRPHGVAALYPMVLLRVADYLQIDKQRTPPVLLQLKDPQSRASVTEWKKHLAVQKIGPATNPRAKQITVSRNISLELYLQLQDLFKGLQFEIDQSTAVLDENYGTRVDLGLERLNLSIRRIYSNLDTKVFRKSLPYIPERTGFSADPHILTLLVEPLYGKEPGVGVRELMQNSVDAVCAVDTWCKARNQSKTALGLPIHEPDVFVEFIKQEDSSWLFRIRDNGVGMTYDTLQNYFLRAGVSFRQSPNWSQEYLDENGHPKALRTGRFGVGAFSIFLLGNSFKLFTRHISGDKNSGLHLEASQISQIIEVKHATNLQIGTTIEIPIKEESVDILGLEDVFTESKRSNKEESTLKYNIDWYCWNWPKIKVIVKSNAETVIIKQQFVENIHQPHIEPHLSIIHPKSFDAVYWTFKNSPSLVCNGFEIRHPDDYTEDYFTWPSDEVKLNEPCITILDSAANLSLTVQRYRLSDKKLPFIHNLSQDTILSFIAHALIHGPISREECHFDAPKKTRHPLCLDGKRHRNYQMESLADHNILQWCSTQQSFIPTDPWTYSTLQSDSCIVHGQIEDPNSRIERTRFCNFKIENNIANEKSLIRIDIYNKDYIHIHR